MNPFPCRYCTEKQTISQCSICHANVCVVCVFGCKDPPYTLCRFCGVWPRCPKCDRDNEDHKTPACDMCIICNGCHYYKHSCSCCPNCMIPRLDCKCRKY